MKTYSMSLKKCLICSCIALLISTSLSFAKLSPTPEKSEPSIQSQIQKDLSLRSSISFKKILENWKKKYGPKAIPPLLSIAKNKSQPDSDRYIAVIALAKIGGIQQENQLKDFLKDRSWMLRIAALRSLVGLKSKKFKKEILSLSNDPALVVRNEVIHAIEKLRFKGSIPILIQSLRNKKNYHHGKAQWVPQSALETLVKIKAPEKVAHFLLPLLTLRKDPKFQTQVLNTLEKLTGKKVKASLSIDQQAKKWREILKKT